MFVKFFIFLCVFVAFNDSAAVDDSKKCGLNDGPCQIKFIQNFIQELSKEGAAGGPLGVDQYKLTNVALSVPDMINATLIEGTVKGFKECVITKLKPNIEAGRATIEVVCDHITVKGRYKFSSTSPAVLTLLATDSIHGDGNVKIKLDKLSATIHIFYKVVERDGDLYLAPKGKKVQLAQFDIGKASINMDNFYLGEEESSKKVVKLLNENFPFLISTFGKTFGNKVLGIGIEYVGQAFSSLPAKNFIIEDLRPYVH